MPIPEVTIDLTKPPEERWVKMLVEHDETVVGILEDVEQEVASWGREFLVGLGKKFLGLFRHLYGAEEYVKEINAIADLLEVDPNLLFASNLAYDITSWCEAHDDLLGKFFGCTGFIDGNGPLLARNMDWDWPRGIRHHSMVIRFTDGLNEFITVGFPGHIGVISGISSSGFSLTVNQAYAARFTPSWTAMPVTWQVRRVLERAPSFKSALKLLTTEKTLTGAFYLVCGEKPGEAALIESDGDQDVVTEVGSGEYAVIANHYLTADIGNSEIWEDSRERQEAMEKDIARTPTMTVARAKRILNTRPVFNYQTAHQVAIEPNGVIHLRCPEVSRMWKKIGCDCRYSG